MRWSRTHGRRCPRPGRPARPPAGLLDKDAGQGYTPSLRRSGRNSAPRRVGLALGLRAQGPRPEPYIRGAMTMLGVAEQFEGRQRPHSAYPPQRILAHETYKPLCFNNLPYARIRLSAYQRMSASTHYPTSQYKPPELSSAPAVLRQAVTACAYLADVTSRLDRA